MSYLSWDKFDSQFSKLNGASSFAMSFGNAGGGIASWVIELAAECITKILNSGYRIKETHPCGDETMYIFVKEEEKG
jgi:hypothetical protein